MSNRFNFHTLPGPRGDLTEANIFIHGYSAGHTAGDRRTLLDSIPESIRHYTNIFAFWKSSHFTHFNSTSRKLLGASVRSHWSAGFAALATDRAAHYWRIRSRAVEVGEVLFSQLNEYLLIHHPTITTINLIGHSLGGRVVVSSLRSRARQPAHRLAINDVLLMAAAVKVETAEAQQLRSLLKGRLINAYSRADWTLLMNLDEACLGRNPVEHFENIPIGEFGHSDYWKKLPEVLTYTQFKTAAGSPSPEAIELATATNPAPSLEKPADEPLMNFELNSPSDIYARINSELAQVIASLAAPSNDETLNQAQYEARTLLIQHQQELQQQLDKLEKNAEWNTFTIAFYGETGAGKSSIIETLRILLQEPGKLANQRAFRDLQSKYGLSEERLQKLQQDLAQADHALGELTQQLNATLQQYQTQHDDTLSHITQLKATIAERKHTASIWQKLLNMLRKMPEEKELAHIEQQLPAILAARDSATTPLAAQKAEAEREKDSLEKQLQESEGYLAELNALADGEIIGDGRPDFTRQTQRYNFELDGQTFALLDVPGIEGKEGLVLEEIEQAVQTAHAVFYVTNQPAPPQTGDEQRKGTLEKIKAHLGAQTEVWTIFNKKITNAKHSLGNRALISADEEASLIGLDDKMREHLGEHYRSTFPLTVLPAFLASTDHFAPNSPNAKRRSKILADFGADELLEKSQLRAFIRLLSDKLLSDGNAKITRANFHKANKALSQATAKLEEVESTFATLAEKLGVEGQSAQTQLNRSFSALKQRLETGGEQLIDNFGSTVRNAMYELIDSDIGNDVFKEALQDCMRNQQERLSKQLPEVMSKEVERFKKDAEDILNRFEQHADDLAAIYNRFSNTGLNETFEFKIKIDNGIKIAGLLGGLLGIAMAPFTGGASLWFLGLSALSVIVSIGKALIGVFNTDYKKSQQRKATDDNLHSASKQLRTSLRNGLDSALPQMQEKIAQLEQALQAPGKQTNTLLKLLIDSVKQLKVLSRQIHNAGTL